MDNSNEVIEIYLNSKIADVISSDFNSDATFYIPNIEIDKKEVVYISVKNCVFPYSWFNVNYTNNILKYSVNNLPYTITLLKGNYNANTLREHIYNLLISQTYPSANDNKFTITYDIKTNKYNFSHLYHEFGFYESSNCFELLGFSQSNKSSINRNLTSDLMINLFPIRMIYITSNNFILNNINHASSSNANIITSINVVGNPYSIITYNDSSNNSHLIHNLNNINNLNIAITDQEGNLINFNGSNWSLTLTLTIKKI
jgi:hypothetical protein